jgi:integrase
VFASPSGQPLHPNTDYHEWKRLLKDAGLREARLHDARHTAATSFALRQPMPTVMSLMGWSSESMAARYQHVTDAMRNEVASQVGELIWQAAGRGQATAMLTVRSDSLAVVLAAAERCATRHGADARQAAS